jgi:hypothetical protein
MENRTLKITSPKGVASYPKLNEPDFKFKEDGEYSVNLLVSEEEAKKFSDEIKAYVKEYYKEQCALLKKKELKLAELPIKKDVDKEGNPTGKFRIKFSLAAKVKSKKSGREWEQRPMLFDSKGQPTKEVVGGGSVIKVAGECYPWFTPALGVGASLRCKAVQIIELHRPGGPVNAEAYGFSAEEEGFVAGGESLPDSVFTAASNEKGNGDF